MIKSDKISIIIPVYNQAKYIARCLRSIFNQSFSSDLFDVFIINDGSKDNLFQEIESFLKKQIKITYLINKTNKGLPFSLNRGILESDSEFIIRIDGDDYVNKDFLKCLHKNLKNSKSINALACDYIVVDNNENVMGIKNCLEDPIACGILFKRNDLIDINLYDENFICNEEKDLRIRFEKKYIIGRLDKALYRYRRHSSNLTNDETMIQEYDKILKAKHS